MTQRLTLLLLTDPKNPRNIPVELTEEPFIIGSAEDSNLPLNDSALLPYHCTLSAGPGGVELTALGENRSTFRNGRPVTATTYVRDGDVIRVGDLHLRVRFDHSGDAGPAGGATAGRATREPTAERAAEPRTSDQHPLEPGGADSPPGFSIARGAAAPDREAAVGPQAVAAPAAPVARTPWDDAAAGGGEALAEVPGAGEAEPPLVGMADVQESPGAAARTPIASSGGGGGVGTGLDVAAPSGDDFIDRAMAELSREYPERVRRRTRREMQAMIERGRERARGYGLEEEGHVMQFLQCVMLLDNELASPSSPEASDVYYTLTVPNKPAAQRIRRALQMAKRIAADRSAGGAGGRAGQSDDHGGGPVSPPVARASSASPASPPPVYARAEPAAGGAAEDPSDAPMSAMDVGAQTTRGTPPPSVEWTPEEAAVVDALPEIEGFQIIDKIASGGMGTVYRAVDMKLDVEVAIKVLRSLHPSAQQQFLLEARAAAKLQHPNIVPVLRYEQYGQGGYFVMQLIKGKDSHKLIRLFGEHMAHDLEADRILELAGIDTSGMIPDLRAASRGAQPYYRFVACWLAGVADGLERAHGQGIIHYDIKPNNIMLAADGRMMLGDFGLATLGGRQSAENLACVGTPAYLAPEMVAAWASRSGTSGTDLRVDVWGVGATLYEFLTYKPAYDGTLAKVLRDITTVDPATPRNIVWHTPPELERICLKAMNRNPDDRYARCGEIADELRNWLMNSVAEGGSRKVAWSWLRRPR